MSEPTRYTAVGNGVVRTDPEGLLIAYGHYLELKAEVERLTKAGDAMAVSLNLNDDVFDNHEKKLAQSAWNAAKEGKPGA
jgi:hypothetical protein